MSRELPLSKGLVALVDDADFDWLNQWKWSARGAGQTHYAHRHAKVDGHWTSIILHREITGAPKGVLVDHRNHNGLDCRRQNLRLCNHVQNSANLKNVKPGAVPYRGVYLWRSPGGRQSFKVQIAHQNRKLGLGYFNDVIEAARAYDDAALALKGEFAILNFPDEVRRRRRAAAGGLDSLSERGDAAVDRTPLGPQSYDLFDGEYRP